MASKTPEVASFRAEGADLVVDGIQDQNVAIAVEGHVADPAEEFRSLGCIGSKCQGDAGAEKHVAGRAPLVERIRRQSRGLVVGGDDCRVCRGCVFGCGVERLACLQVDVRVTGGEREQGQEGDEVSGAQYLLIHGGMLLTGRWRRTNRHTVRLQ